MKKDYVLVEFNGDETSFDYNVSKAEYLFTALMGLEATVCKETGLDIYDVREVIDEMKGRSQAKVNPNPHDPSVVVQDDDGSSD